MAYREDYIVDGVLYYTRLCEGSVIQPFSWKSKPDEIDTNIYAHRIEGYPYIVGKDSIMLYEAKNIQEDKEMTPCEEKGYKVGQVFEITEAYKSGMYGKSGDIVVLIEDSDTSMPFFHHITGTHKGDKSSKDLDSVLRIYPPEEKVIETIDIFGQSFPKAEVEAALRNITAIKS